MKRILLTATAFLLLGTQASAYIDLGNGYVELEYGDSYGSVGADYDINYYNLGYYNGVDPDQTVVYPGDIIQLGYASAAEYYYGETTSYSDCYNYNYDYSYDYGYGYDCGYNYDYGYNYDCGYNYNYGYDYGYSYDYGYNSGYDYTLNNNYGYTSGTDYYETPAAETSAPVYDYSTVIGSASYAIGYAGNAGQNVSRACELNNEVIIPAGGTYRASDYIGSGSYDMGFVDAPGLMSNGSTPLMPGSGICPVTTYICKAGRDAGLTILEANDHSGASCAYAAPGEQAMYNFGTSDLVMANPYDHPIKITCSYVDGNLSASISE